MANAFDQFDAPATAAKPQVTVTPSAQWTPPTATAPPPAASGNPFDKFDEAALPAPPEYESVNPLTNYSQMVDQAWGQMGRGVSQIETGDPLTVLKGIGNLGLGTIGYVGAPISAPIHSFVGAPVANATGMPLLGTAADIGAGFALPVPKGIAPIAKMPVADDFGVTLSAGERAGNLAQRQAEQNAIRGAGPGTEAWMAQRESQLAAAKTGISQSLDQFGQEIAENPQQAGAVVSAGMQGAAAAGKAAVKGAYDLAKSLPGEIHADAFSNMGQGIKGDLSLRDNPVIIDDKLTPFASQAIQDIDNGVSQLKIQNRASPFGQPSQGDIAGINLQGVDQMRKRLSAFTRGAYSSGNAADGRAAQAVLDAFDRRIDDAINGGQFTGDPRAIQAWNDARAAYRDYRGTFTARKGDPVGRTVEKIIGANGGGKLPVDPAIPNDVADYLYGAQGVNPGSLNVGVANRVREVLGPQSPEWSAVKQGLFRRLVEKPQGVTDWGTGQIANRLNKFLNGDGAELSQSVYSLQERQMLQRYADLMRKITMPPGTYFPSGPSFGKVMLTVANRVAAVAGALIGRALVPEMPLVGELGGLTVGSQAEKVAVRAAQNRVAKQLPLVAQQWDRWSKAQSAAAAAPKNPLLQRAAVTATANLQGTLTPLIGKIQELAAQGPGTANASPQQQNVPRPPAQ